MTPDDGGEDAGFIEPGTQTPHMVASGEPASGTLRFEALWIFREEVKRAGFSAEWDAHTSQPLGRPLHKHEGYIEVGEEAAALVEGGNRTEIPKSEIRNLRVGFDKDFRRLKDSRGVDGPMHFSFSDEVVYIFTRSPGSTFWRGENIALFDAIAK